MKSEWPDIDLSRSPKVKCHGVIGLAIYASLLMVNSNIGPDLAPLVIRLWNLDDLDFHLSRSFKVKSGSAIVTFANLVSRKQLVVELHGTKFGPQE